MNKRQVLALAAGVLSLVTGIIAARVYWFSSEPVPDEPQPVNTASKFSAGEKRVSGPYTHKNLTVYLVHGDNTLKGRSPLTLEEAMDRELVIVHETGDVNELSIENTSPKDEVFVQAGDIVKGGQQDRVLGVDLIVPTRSGRIPIDSFCVEQGRWRARGSESRDRFNSSADYVPSKDLKMAAKHSKSQSEVWEKVAESQEKLSAAIDTNAASNVSRSSLPLTLENEHVRADSSEYIKALSTSTEGKTDVIGFLIIINGRINSAEIYGSSELFLKLWPKLRKAAAIEAVAESHLARPDEKVPGPAEIETFFASAERGKITEERKVTERIGLTVRESDETVFLETLDRQTMIHLSYIQR